jgi:TonB-dependent SusC/RagA subfamily outer membrane receptor
MSRTAVILITTIFAIRTLNGQQPADSPVARSTLNDSILASGIAQGWLRRERGIDVGTLDASGGAFTTAPSLALALQARLAGVSVSQGQGLVGSPSQLLLRGPASFRVHEPLLIIDGARTHASQEDRGSLRALPSRLEHLDPDIIERVEVLRGAAASALYGPGASRGVILVTTKRGARGPARWTAFAESGPLLEVTDFPATFATTGATAGGATVSNCPLYERATGACTPIATQSWNPLERASPFRAGWSSSAGLGISGGSSMLTYRATGSAERADGVYEADRARAINGHLDLGLAATQTIDVRVTGGVRSERFRRPTGGYLRLGLFGDAADDPIRHGYDDLGGFLTGPVTEPGRHDLAARRITASLAATWRPSANLRASALIGYDDLRLNDDFTESVPRSPGSADSSTTIQRSKDKPAARTAAFRVERTFELRGMSARTGVGADYSRDDDRGSALEQFSLNDGPPVAESRTTLDRRREDYGAYFQQHLAKGPLAVTGSMRADFARGPFATALSPSVDASWVALAPDRSGSRTIGDLRIRAAWARGGGHLIQSGEVDNSFYGGHPSEEMAERASELELGADGSLFASRLQWSVTGYRALHDQALIPVPASGGGQRVTNDGRIVTRGFEASIDARAVEATAFIWDVGAIHSAHRSENRSPNARGFYNPGDFIPSNE